MNERKQIPVAPTEIPFSKTSANIDSHNEKVSDFYNKNVLVRCPNCTRTFLEDRLSIHLRSCTEENPHKPPPSKEI